MRGRDARRRASPRPEPGAASLYQAVPFRQDTSYLAIGERSNANGSKKFREAMQEARWDGCVEMAREQIREGAHLLDVCIAFVGRDGVADMEEVVGRFATASTLPLVIDSTELTVLEAALEKLGGRAVINSINFEDGDGPSPGSPSHRAGRRARRGGDRADHRRGGHGQDGRGQAAHRRAADRRLTGNWGLRSRTC